MKQNREDFYFFWKGPFSQWARFEMEIDKMVYNTCEQFMMAEKAKLFGDVEIYSKIMKSDSPKKQKELGRQVKNFDEKKWKEVAREIVFKANYAKFSQHPHLRDKLIETRNKIMAEVNPYDCVWGIGLGADDDRALDVDEWRGTNWLGEVLMEVRDELKLEKLEMERKNESN